MIHTSHHDGLMVIVVEPKDEKAFRELVQRGANLWPDAPPDIKSFADIITNGEVLQDYHSQDTSKKN